MLYTVSQKTFILLFSFPFTFPVLFVGLFARISKYVNEVRGNLGDFLTMRLKGFYNIFSQITSPSIWQMYPMIVCSFCCRYRYRLNIFCYWNNKFGGYSVPKRVLHVCCSTRVRSAMRWTWRGGSSLWRSPWSSMRGWRDRRWLSSKATVRGWRTCSFAPRLR